MDPLSFDFRLAEFDLSLLPVQPEMLKGNEAMMRSTLQEHLRVLFERVPGEWRITHHENHISVIWLPETSQDMDSLMDLVIGLIHQRAFGQAETILRTLFSRYPDDRRVLFNLGIMLCEQGRLQEAREVLIRLTRTAPDFANGWNALGVALSREGKRKDASSAFQKSLGLDPENGYTLRNLGALMGRKDPQEALRYLKRAAKLLPSDQPAQYTYGKCLMDKGSLADADPVLKKAIALNEGSEIADLCREARIKIARRNLKAAVPRGLRTDVVVFCLAALETFKEVGRERTQASLIRDRIARKQRSQHQRSHLAFPSPEPAGGVLCPSTRRIHGCGPEEGGPPDGSRYRLLQGVRVCTRHVAGEEREIQVGEIKVGETV